MTARVRAQDILKAIWPTPATLDDVLTAQVNLGLPDGPWTPADAKRIGEAVVGIVRDRRPRYRIGGFSAGEFTPFDDFPVPDSLQYLVLVVDEEGRLDNFKEAADELRALAEAEAKNDDTNEASRLVTTGTTVEGAARRQGISERTARNRRKELRSMDVDPDTLAPTD